jgi:hypothetical protein
MQVITQSLTVLLSFTLAMSPALAQSVATPSSLPVRFDSYEEATQIFPALVGVDLSPEQQAQLLEVTKKTLIQVNSALTPEQQNQFWAGLKTGRGLRATLLTMQIPPSQRLQLLPIVQSANSEIGSIFTPEQQAQVKANAEKLK